VPFAKKQVAAIDTEHIVEQLKNGKHGAYEAVFKSWYEPLCSYACSMLRDMDEAEEVVQKMFCMLWDKRAELDVQQSLQSYLYKTVHNRCLNHIRHGAVHDRYKSEFMHLNEEAHDSANARVEYGELQQVLSRAVAQLPEQPRKVFELSRAKNLSYQEIAEQLQLSRNTVENHMGKALRLLRESLKDYLPFIAFLFFTKP
jgi:RNA polymerase sigma-70 factor (ECF subfamily)